MDTTRPPLPELVRTGLRSVPRDHAIRAVVALAGVFVLVLVVLYEGFDVEARLLVADPSEVLDFPSWYGALSYVGVLGWWTGATAAACGAALAPVGTSLRHHLPRLAIATAFLALDDLFRIHEEVSNATGVPEGLVYLAYLPLVAWAAWRALPALAPELPLLLVAAVGLGGSLASDVVSEVVAVTFRGSVVLEEGSKFLGLVAWSSALAAAARRAPAGDPPVG